MDTIVQQIERVIGEPTGQYQGAILYATACIVLILACIACLLVIRWLTRW